MVTMKKDSSVPDSHETTYVRSEDDGSQASVREQLLLDLYTPLIATTALSPDRLGTFQDNLRAPIHRWFKYPAGFSYKLVDAVIDDKGLRRGDWLLDPFVGSGTTTLAAKERGINSVGVEAHPFVSWVARVKCFWDYDMDSLYQQLQTLIARIHHKELLEAEPETRFPELVHKCYSAGNLHKLAFIRSTITHLDCTSHERDFFLLGLTDTLRSASTAGTGWPYIAPSKYHEKQERDGIETFSTTVKRMYKDLVAVRERCNVEAVECRLLEMDARDRYPLDADSIDAAVSSPPYLNNYDYADRTRLEMYFLGWATSWRDITERVRDKLIFAATTQIRRTEFSDEPVSGAVQEADPQVYAELRERVRQLERIRHTKGGKKSYDLMVAGYFNDLLQVLKQVYRVMRPESNFVLVLGDSAPYGVHIPTEEYLGRLALGVGFSSYRFSQLRERGGKWGHNTQRHKVMLKESLLILTK
jgi:DNA modification methylase